MMQPYYAHKTDDGRVQTVHEHCAQVAEIAKSFGDSLSLGNTAYLCGLYHDLGKNQKAFQEYLFQNNDLDAKHLTKISRGKIDHSYAGAKYLYENVPLDSPLAVVTAELLGIVIASHHGLSDCLKSNGEDLFLRRIQKNGGYGEALAEAETSYLGKEKLQQVFDKACNEVAAFQQKVKSIGRNTSFYYGMLARMILSMVIDGDHSDTADFCRGQREPRCKYDETLWKKVQNHLEEKLASFSETDPISRKRRQISDQCLAKAAMVPGIYQLIVPTGGGKTLASLRYALEHAIRYRKERIFYLAPYHSILEQNSEELRKVIQDDSVFLEHHCNVENDSEIYELMTQTWDSPFIATTMVQFLNALFSHKTSAIRRMHALSNSIIIIDEVQSLPVKCLTLFNLALNFLAKFCDATVILCSATQPALDAIKDAPLLYAEPKSLLNGVDASFAEFKRTEVIDRTSPPLSYEEAARMIREQLENNGNVLVVVNTKQTALALYHQLLLSQQGGQSFALKHLSTNMCPAHREKEIQTIRDTLKNREPLVCISTQLIEAGVDLSFGCVIRSFAGLDSVAQAAGRCNRNGESACKNVYVIRLREESLGKLPEISQARDAAEAVLYETKSGEDLLAPAVMDKFYHRYYQTESQQEVMKYILPEERTTIFDLLSANQRARSAYRETTGKDISAVKRFFCQGFQTAATNFHAIENNTTSVLVPYNDKAKRLIREISFGSSKSVIKAAQKYSIAVYPQTFQRLRRENAVIMQQNSGAWVLDERYYDISVGLRLDAAPMELDMI